MAWTARLHEGPCDGLVEEVGLLTSPARPRVVKTVVHRTESAYRPRPISSENSSLIVNGHIVHEYWLAHIDADDIGHYYHREPKHPTLVCGVL